MMRVLPEQKKLNFEGGAFQFDDVTVGTGDGLKRDLRIDLQFRSELTNVILKIAQGRF